MYLNGRRVAIAGPSFGTAGDVSTVLCLGCRTGSYISQGATAQARLYSRALSDSDVAQLYADPLAGARAPVSAARYFVPATISPPTADRLWNRGYVGRIFRRGEKG
jgi:hypothetical protein